MTALTDSASPSTPTRSALGQSAGSASGPTYCAVCGEWPARVTERGNRCHLCESREWCEEHPVPLPSNLETVKELADLGYEPAIRHLSQNAERIHPEPTSQDNE